MRHLLVSGTILAALALPSAATAAQPAKANFLNEDTGNGARFQTTRHKIKHLDFFCDKTRYSLLKGVHVPKSGRFSFEGRARRFGKSGEPLGIYAVRLSGRFTSPTRAKIRRTLKGCGTATVIVKGRRSG
jgi:hypothetical protein